MARPRNIRGLRPPEQRMLLWIALILMVLVVGAFARTWFLRTSIGLGPLPVFIHIHASVMLGWVITLVLQTALVVRGRLQWHRWLGWAGVLLAAGVIAMGTIATWRAASREVTADTPDAWSQVLVLALELTQMALFAGLISAAIAFRNRPGWHSRLMLMATMAMVANPIVRILSALDVQHVNVLTLGLLAALLITIIVIDGVRRHRLHPVLVWGGCIVLGCLIIALHIGAKPWWQAAASRWVRSVPAGS